MGGEGKGATGAGSTTGLGKYNHYHDEAGRFTTADNAVEPFGPTRNWQRPKGVQVASLDTVASDVGGRSANAQATQVAQITEPEPIEPPPAKPPEGARPTESPEAKPTGTVADAVAPNGKLPGSDAPPGEDRTMPASDDPTLTARTYAEKIYNGQKPLWVRLLGDEGGFVAHLPDGAYITFRPAGQASSRTLSTTATVEINDPKLKLLNGGRRLKLKFPKQ